MGEQDAPWLIVIAKPMAEKLARDRVRQAGYRVYLPVTVRVKTGHRAGKGELVEYPLFPRYLFAQYHRSMAWWELRSTIGVSRILETADEQPRTLPDRLIEEIRLRENAGEFDIRPVNDAPYRFTGRKIGMRIKITHGPFAGELGTLARLDGNHRVGVLLDIMRKLSDQPIPVPREIVDAAE